ncbi:hypothetical protein ACFL9T_05325 [Thermodesulfobacteriota bacterium]
MANPIQVNYYPLFEKGIFNRHPQLFDRFFKHTSESLKKRYQQNQETISKFEETVKWPLIAGPGFCGATHPGTENTFSAIMGNSNALIYNADCLYVNPSLRVFAISDAPGMTTASRQLVTKLDDHLQKNPIEHLEKIINDLDRETDFSQKATLSMIRFSQMEQPHKGLEATILKAGDTRVFRGNYNEGKITELEGNPNFIGNSGSQHKASHLGLEEGDFFILVSDGMVGITPGLKDMKLGEDLQKTIKNKPESFIFRAIEGCNRIFQKKISSRTITKFGGNDNVSILLITPHNLQQTCSKEIFTLGGYIGSG